MLSHKQSQLPPIASKILGCLVILLEQFSSFRGSLTEDRTMTKIDSVFEYLHKAVVVPVSLLTNIRTTVKVCEEYYGHKFETSDFCLITEEGVANVKVYPFPDLKLCEEAAAPLYCCWIIMEKGNLIEMKSGGIGFAHGRLRTDGISTVNAM